MMQIHVDFSMFELIAGAIAQFLGFNVRYDFKTHHRHCWSGSINSTNSQPKTLRFAQRKELEWKEKP